MKKSFLLMFLVLMSLFLAVSSTNALIDSCVLNNPGQNRSVQYDNGLIRLNVTADWSQAGFNITNVTITIGSLNYTNSTVNGTGGQATSIGDFTFTVNSSQVNSDGAFSAYATCFNTTDAQQVSGFVSSSTITYTIDSTDPRIALERPQDRISLGASNGVITFEYTPTETNLGNCTLYLGGNRIKSSTSATTTPNISSGGLTKFTRNFPADNTSLTWNVECRDLAGRSANATARTISVLVSGFANVVDPSGGVTRGGKEYYVEKGKTLSVGSQGSQLHPKPTSTFLSQFGWVIALVVVAGFIYMIFKWKPKG